MFSAAPSQFGVCTSLLLMHFWVVSGLRRVPDNLHVLSLFLYGCVQECSAWWRHWCAWNGRSGRCAQTSFMDRWAAALLQDLLECKMVFYMVKDTNGAFHVGLKHAVHTITPWILFLYMNGQQINPCPILPSSVFNLISCFVCFCFFCCWWSWYRRGEAGSEWPEKLQSSPVCWGKCEVSTCNCKRIRCRETQLCSQILYRLECQYSCQFASGRTWCLDIRLVAAIKSAWQVCLSGPHSFILINLLLQQEELHCWPHIIVISLAALQDFKSRSHAGARTFRLSSAEKASHFATDDDLNKDRRMRLISVRSDQVRQMTWMVIFSSSQLCLVHFFSSLVFLHVFSWCSHLIVLWKDWQQFWASCVYSLGRMWKCVVVSEKKKDSWQV